MSININCVSDKPTFTNYFSEPIVLPERAELTLVKANMDIPILEVSAVTVPGIAPADYNKVACEVNIDGIVENITYQNLYDAYALFNAYDIDNTVLIGDFYGGEYELFPNHRLLVDGPIPPPAGNPGQYQKIPFIKILAAAINAKYEFYTITGIAENLATDEQNNTDWEGAGGIQTNRGSAESIIISNILKENSLVAVYAPQKLTDNNLTTTVFNASDNSNFTISGNQLTSTATNINQCWGGSDNLIDLNGGWWQTTFTYGGTGKAVYGISLVGVGHGGDRYNPITATYEPEVFDVGFEFDLDGAKQVYRIIDGQNLNSVPPTPIYRPTNAKLEFNNLDRFFIQIQRGNLYNGTNEFVINLYQGHRTHDFNASEYTKLIYTAKRTLNNPLLRPNIGFMTEANAGHIFSENEYIARLSQTDQQAQYTDLGNGATYVGQFQVDPFITEPTGLVIQEQRSFWSAYGFLSFDTNSAGIGGMGNEFTSFEGVNQSLKLTRKTNVTTENANIRYYLGQVPISDIYNTTNALVGVQLQINNNNAITNLPQEFKVGLVNVPVKAFQGSYITSNNYSTTSGGEQRIIGTIPIPPVENNAVSIPIQYEPFNLLYRPLSNVNPFSINKLDLEIYYLDFDTNIRKTFNSINGHLTLDINCRQGAKEPPVKNNLRPI